MIYVVSGVPRSLTTCMMTALHEGGLPAVKAFDRDKFGKSLATSNYEANPGAVSGSRTYRMCKLWVSPVNTKVA